MPATVSTPDGDPTRRNSPSGATKGAVGKSYRSVGKHEVLDKILGREVGVVGVKRWTYQLIDLCAGNGQPNEHSELSSPELLIRHAAYLWGRRRPARVHLFERDRSTYDELRSRVPELVRAAAHHQKHSDPVPPPEFFIDCVDVHHGDVRTLLPSLHLEKTTAIFVNNDPNKISDWALTVQVFDALRAVTPNITTFSTMGCNVGGYRRILPAFPERLADWRGSIESTVSRIPRSHDALVGALEKDAARWGYLITGPAKWKARYHEGLTKAFSGAIKTAWWRDDPTAFTGIIQSELLYPPLPTLNFDP